MSGQVYQVTDADIHSLIGQLDDLRSRLARVREDFVALETERDAAVDAASKLREELDFERDAHAATRRNGRELYRRLLAASERRA